MVFKRIIFQNRYVELETPPFMEKNILNFHFDYLHPYLRHFWPTKWSPDQTESFFLKLVSSVPNTYLGMYKNYHNLILKLSYLTWENRSNGVCISNPIGWVESSLWLATILLGAPWASQCWHWQETTECLEIGSWPPYPASTFPLDCLEMLSKFRSD